MDPEKADVLMLIGAALLSMQGAERCLRFCLTWVFQKDGPITLEKLETQELAERKKTMGYFLRELRNRAQLDDRFELYLERFLEDRNTLAHALDEVPGWNLESKEGRDIARQFCDRCLVESFEVMKILTALTRAWMEQVGLKTPYPAGSEELFSEIEHTYLPHVDCLFASRSCSET